MHHRLVVSGAQTGDRLGARLRAGNAGPAEGIADWLPGLIVQARRPLAQHVRLRLDAGFCDAPTPEAVKAGGVGYMVRLRTNQRLARLFDPHRTRDPDRPAEQPREWTLETSYAAGSWPSSNPRAAMFRQGFSIVTNRPASPHNGDPVVPR